MNSTIYAYIDRVKVRRRQGWGMPQYPEAIVVFVVGTAMLGIRPLRSA